MSESDVYRSRRQILTYKDGLMLDYGLQRRPHIKPTVDRFRTKPREHIDPIAGLMLAQRHRLVVGGSGQQDTTSRG